MSSSAEASHEPARPGILLWAMLAGLLVPYGILLHQHWWRSGSIHGIPSLISLGLAVLIGWQQLKGSTPERPGAAAVGLLALAASVLLYLLGACVVEKRTIAGLGATGVLVSLLYLWRGRSGLRQLWLPLVLLVFTIPMPGVFVELLTFEMVDVASRTAAAVLGCVYGDLTREGAIIVIGGGRPIEVVGECSGLKGTLLYVPLALGLLYVFPRIRLVGAVILLALAIPMALFANLMRVLVTAILVAEESAWQDSDTLHEALGVTVLGIGMVLLFLLASRLGRARPEVQAA